MLRGGEVFRNRVKRLLAEKKKLPAVWLQAASPIATEIMVETGPDILMVDMEYGSGGIMGLIGQLQAVSHYDVAPFARVSWNDFVTTKWVPDAGVSGILVPYASNTEEATRAMSAYEYLPEGIRDTAPSPGVGGCGMNRRNYLDYTNEELDVLVAMEIKMAMGHIEEIARTDELNGILISPMDLVTSFGHFRNPKDEEVQEAIRRVEAVVLESDKSLATVAGSFEEVKKLYEEGCSMVIMMSDATTLGKVAPDQAEQFKEMYLQR